MSTNTNIIIYIRANEAKSGPPLGTTLGNLGVNTVKFCKEFNDHTNELPNYFLLKVSILINENKSFTFKVDLPSTGFLISILKKEETFKDENGSTHISHYITLEDFLMLAKFKFPAYDLKKSSKIIKGSLLSSRVVIK